MIIICNRVNELEEEEKEEEGGDDDDDEQAVLLEFKIPFSNKLSHVIFKKMMA